MNESKLEKLCKYYPTEENNNKLICLVPKEMNNWDINKCYKPKECPFLNYYKETKQVTIMYVNK